MNPRQSAHVPLRQAVTLIELLVVISIMLVLASIIVGFSIRNGDRKYALDGADRLSGWLLLTKQWALRDQAPRGLRLLIDTDPASPTYWMVTQLQYIEQPDAWVAPGATISYTNGSNLVKNPGATPADYSGGYQDSVWKPTWPIAPGDLLEMGSGANARVARINVPIPPPIPPPSAVIYLNGSRYEMCVDSSTLPEWSGTDWRIIRQPRPRPGEALLTLPPNVVIDVRCNNWQHPSNPAVRAYGWEPLLALLPAPPAAPPTPPPQVDILFSPTGAVLGAFQTELKLWVRDTSVPSPQPGPPANPYLYGGEFFIVTINLHTSLISVHPADQTLDPAVTPRIYRRPYSFSQDGRSSGL